MKITEQKTKDCNILMMKRLMFVMILVLNIFVAGTSYAAEDTPVTSAGDRKYFKYYIGIDKNETIQVMLVAGMNADGTVDKDFKESDIINQITYKYEDKIYFINKSGDIEEYDTDGITLATDPLKDDPNKDSVITYLDFEGKDGDKLVRDYVKTNNWAFSGGAKISTAQAKNGNSSVYFDGSTAPGAGYETNSTFLYATNTILTRSHTEDFTVEFWVYPERDNVENEVLFMNQHFNFGLFHADINNLKVCHDGVAEAIYTFSDSDYGINKWQHIAMVYTKNDNMMNTFLNGKSINKTEIANFGGINNYIPKFSLGNETHPNQRYPFKGYIDDLKIYDGVAVWTGNFVIN